MPSGKENTSAFFRRFILVPFDVTIPKNERDPNLHLKIIENELSGVFNWALEGLNRVLKQKSFSESELSNQALNSYKKEDDDSFKIFLKDNQYITSVDSFIRLNEVYNHYSIFCKESGLHPLTNKKFSNRLKSYGFGLERRNFGMIAFMKINEIIATPSSLYTPALPPSCIHSLPTVAEQWRQENQDVLEV